MRLEDLLPYLCGVPGRPPEVARHWLAPSLPRRSSTSRVAQIERLRVDRTLYQLCGWSSGDRLPSEATFSRAFAEFADSAMHETLIARTLKDHLVGHISRDAGDAARNPCRRLRLRRRRGTATKGRRASRQLTMMA